VLEAYLAVFTERYLQAKHQLPADAASTAHQQLQAALQAPQDGARQRPPLPTAQAPAHLRGQ